MNYISTRGNHPAISAGAAINAGMVPDGGLFIPESIPSVPSFDIQNSYQKTAQEVLTPFLTDFTQSEISECIQKAYNPSTFDTPDIIDLHKIDNNRTVMELWHGPTAAFKDMALQIMPHFMKFSKEKINNKNHTVILVATSGDTGKAALEGFKDCEGISIIVFYPFCGVSNIQKLQMATTDGNNTHVIAVKGNFDDCQTGVKEIFSDASLRADLNSRGIEFSSANSINWGRLSPQIIYYIQSYLLSVKNKTISYGDPVDFCVPTGNFGNILAGYYAKKMGLPIRKLICASNKNKILSDFFNTGIYNRNRDFFQTVSPSMDILISSNLERFLFETSGHNAEAVREWYTSLSNKGRFAIDHSVQQEMSSFVEAGWVDEKTVLSTIADIYKKTGYIIDTHTSVAVSVLNQKPDSGLHTIITSTASPFKFSCDVLKGIEDCDSADEFSAIEIIANLTGKPVHRAVADLRKRPILHNKVIDIHQMKNTVVDIIKTL
jgi:threonine synthase